MNRCTRCDVGLRPRNSRIKDHPGTRRAGSFGLCCTCYAGDRAAILEAKKSPDPAPGTVDGLNAYLRARRNRLGVNA